MANFRTHVTTSSVLGIGYAGMGTAMGFPIETALVGGGLCGVSGMLPDLDSDTGIPIRESMGFAAGIIPMLLVDRFQAIGMPYDRMVLLTASLYFLIRFAGASLLGRFTVHRGMFHSIPAVLIFAGIAFLLCGYADHQVRYFKAGAVFVGAMSHLCLDELYSIQWRRGRWRFKRSFGTAIKFWGNNLWANVSTYAKLAVVGVMIAGEPGVMRQLQARNPQFAERLERIHGYQDHVIGSIRGRVAPETGQGHESAPPAPRHAPTEPIPGSAQPRWQRDPWQSSPTGTAPRGEDGFRPNAGQSGMQSRQANEPRNVGYRPR